MSSKSFLEVCEDFFDELHPNFYKDENIELIKYNKPKETNDNPDSLCNIFINYLTNQYLYICSYFDSEPNNEINYHVC